MLDKEVGFGQEPPYHGSSVRRSSTPSTSHHQRRGHPLNGRNRSGASKGEPGSRLLGAPAPSSGGGSGGSSRRNICFSSIVGGGWNMKCVPLSVLVTFLVLQQLLSLERATLVPTKPDAAAPGI
ncbi:unnamed protein product, partial [Ectocarpus sp. 4 AP-2014]